MARRLLILEGRRTELPPKEFELLATLAARPGEAVSAKELIKNVWPESSVMTPHDLYWYVWSLRRMIGDSDRHEKLIANRRGVGYYLDLPPEEVEILESGLVPFDRRSASDEEADSVKVGQLSSSPTARHPRSFPPIRRC